ncbi:chaperonin 10-like protein [Lasiosphaeria hispida]|uniref:Chaperonin 10-like protein n=1 Tax=Lasiosphaeria hispida TaxID=260671 RepID=A0AAJ0HKQ3_9PEZI|nr:chaperonin 10-like protein [Lasiosphaeria hispida]
MADIELPDVMKAQFLDAFSTAYTLRSVPLPTLSSPHDILIRVDAASYCHTDAVLAAGKMPPYPLSFPHVGCHEFAGTIVALPSDSPSLYRVGSRVGVPGRSFHPCGTCFECSSGPSALDPDADPPGYSVYCPRSQNNGISAPGGFRQYAVVDSRQVAPIPDAMSAVDTATLMCAGVTIYAALKRCGLKVGQRVGIVGCGGGLGHLGLLFAAHMGLKVVGIDNADAPLKLARSTTSEARIVDARVEEAANIVAELGEADGKSDRGDMGIDAVIILPESQKAFDYGITLLRNHGKCVVVSFPERGFQLSARDVVFRDISIVGSLVGSNKILREMLEFADKHNVRASVKTFPLSRLNDLVNEYHKAQGGKLVIDMALPNDLEAAP